MADDSDTEMADADTDDGLQKSIVAPCLEWVATNLSHPFLLRPTTTADLIEGTEDGLLHATARLGLPLYYHILQVGHPFYGISLDQSRRIQKAKEDGILVSTDYNKMLYHLSTETIPYSPQTKHTKVADDPTPTILLRRVDGKHLSEYHVKLMWLLMNSELSNPVTRPIIHQRITPDLFVSVWSSVNKSDHCPVTLACKACGKDEGAMQRCEECGVVRYCSLECQFNDFDAHNKVCVKG